MSEVEVKFVAFGTIWEWRCPDCAFLVTALSDQTTAECADAHTAYAHPERLKDVM